MKIKYEHNNSNSPYSLIYYSQTICIMYVAFCDKFYGNSLIVAKNNIRKNREGVDKKWNMSVISQIYCIIYYKI